MNKVFSTLLVSLIAIGITGCGKSAEQQKLEAEMTKQVMDMVTSARTSLTQVDGLVGQLDGAVAQADSMVKGDPKVAEMVKTDDIKGAKEKLMAARESLSNLVSGLKAYDLSMKHEDLIAKVKMDKEDLSVAIQSLEGAMTAATSAIDNHKKIVEDMMAKVATKAKKIKR